MLCVRRWISLLLIATGLLRTSMAGANPWNIPAPDLPARAYMLIEAQSGTELASFNADAHLPPASLTKLMTAYLLFGDLRDGKLGLDEHITVSRYAAHLPGARMFLQEGESVAVADLFKGMLVQSGNDAAFTLIEHAGGTLPLFVARMNAKAAELGLTNTHFANATGLNNPRHYSSARDLTRLALAVRRDFPEYAGWFAQREFRWAGITQPNRNPLLRDPGVDGIKTGHTEAAGYCLVASAQRDGMQLIATLLGTDSEQERARSGRRLLDFGFRQFETQLSYRAGIPVTTLPLWLGEKDSVALGVDQDKWITLPRGGLASSSTRLKLPDTVLAPVVRGEPLGLLELMYNNSQVTAFPLVSLDTVPEAGLAKRTADQLRLWLQGRGVAHAGP